MWLDKQKRESITLSKTRLFKTPEELHEMNKDMSTPAIAKVLGVSPSTIQQALSKAGYELNPDFNTSRPEIVMQGILNSLGVEYKKDRRILYPREIDFLIVDHSLGIEVNGVYTHSESKGMNKTYHLSKTEQAADKNIRLLHF
jgi:hypothetical protein